MAEEITLKAPKPKKKKGIGCIVSCIVMMVVLAIFIFIIAFFLIKQGIRLVPPYAGVTTKNGATTNSLPPGGNGTPNGGGGQTFSKTPDKNCTELLSAMKRKSGDEKIMSYFEEASRTFNIPLNVLIAQAEQESAFNPQAFNESSGASGMMQFLPGTFADVGGSPGKIFDIHDSIFFGAKYLSQQRTRFGSMDKALAAYNAGPGNVERFGGIPPFDETQKYVRQILSRAEQYRRCLEQQTQLANSTDIPLPKHTGINYIRFPKNVGTDFNNFGALDLKQKDLSIVLHNTVTPVGSGVPQNFFGSNPEVISHFVIDGKNEFQLLPVDKISRGTASFNSHSISIEMVYQDPNTKQFEKGPTLDTTSEVVADLMVQHRIPLSRLYAHSEIANGTTDDGRSIPLDGETYPGDRSDPGQVNMNYIKDKLRNRSDLRNLGLIDL